MGFMQCCLPFGSPVQLHLTGKKVWLSPSRKGKGSDKTAIIFMVVNSLNYKIAHSSTSHPRTDIMKARTLLFIHVSSGPCPMADGQW